MLNGFFIGHVLNFVDFGPDGSVPFDFAVEFLIELFFQVISPDVSQNIFLLGLPHLFRIIHRVHLMQLKLFGWLNYFIYLVYINVFTVLSGDHIRNETGSALSFFGTPWKHNDYDNNIILAN